MTPLQPINDRQRRMVAAMLQDPTFLAAVKAASERTPGTCPACGRSDAKVVFRDPRPRCFLGQCLACGAALRWSKRDRLVWVKDEAKLSAAELAELAELRKLCPPPALPACPYCGMRARMALTYPERAMIGLAATSGSELVPSTPTPLAFCNRCGGALRIVDGQLLAELGALAEADQFRSDSIRAAMIARTMLEDRTTSREARA